ncbi:hypothetical protein [Achromobacter insuavis]|uniref:hypothetical protein n=1 Tax=Achromobacter insuavis TaxID=1287735 RepID=UPI001EED77F2|nr:hypothetical protein [Achromobacter insuavis]
MATRVKLLYFKPTSVRARLWPVGIALRWTLGLIPTPQSVTMGQVQYGLIRQSESTFWVFALRVAIIGEAIIVTRNGQWDPAGTVDGCGIHAFGRDFQLLPTPTDDNASLGKETSRQW